MKNNTGKETKPQFKLRSWDRLEVTCRNESHLNSLLASRWRLPWFQTCNIHRLYIKDGRNAELEFNASFPLAPTHLNLAFGHFPLQLNYHLCVGGVFIATRPKIPMTSCDTNNIVTEGMRTMWWCTCWLCAAIFIAGFQKYGWISGWMDGVSKVVNEALSWLIQWCHSLTNQWHAVCWQHIFSSTHLTWNPGWVGILLINIKIKKKKKRNTTSWWKPLKNESYILTSGCS